MSDLTDRGRTLRNYDPEEFIAAYRNAEDMREIQEYREALRHIDGGRFHAMLDEAHTHIGHSDLTSRQSLRETGLYSDTMLQWIAVFGMLEDLSTYPDMTHIERDA